MPTHKGVYGRTHGQAYRAGEEKAASSTNDITKGEDGNEISKDGGAPNVVHIKHNDGPPYHVKHEDGSVTKHDSHADLMAHLHEHIPGAENEDNEVNDGMDPDYGSEGSEEAIKSLLE